MTDAQDLSARNLTKYGLRRSAYNGAHGRRFCFFVTDGASEWRNEFATKRERDTALGDALRKAQGS